MGGYHPAHQTVCRAVKAGRLIKPDVCAKCGGAAKLHGHHYRGYARENWLNVQWLCSSCHLEAHGQPVSRRDREKAVVEARKAGMTLQQIGDAMGFSRQRALQILQKAEDGR